MHLDGFRILDLLISVLLMFVLMPLYMIIFFLIKITSHGPAIHWSRRVGLNSDIFLMPKFRTMKVEAPDIATDKLQDPERYITYIGSVLRKTSIDEIPQLFNVLKGEMSLVGPRPHPVTLDLSYSTIYESFLTRYRCNPGLTGWAQINGRDKLPIREKVSFDLYYLKNKSIFLDLKIMYLTIFKIFRKEGISH